MASCGNSCNADVGEVATCYYGQFSENPGQEGKMRNSKGISPSKFGRELPRITRELFSDPRIMNHLEIIRQAAGSGRAGELPRIGRREFMASLFSRGGL